MTGNTTPAVTYPAWQQNLRQAQAARNAQQAERDAEIAHQHAEAAARHGQALAKALLHFGIVAEPTPVTNHYELGGYEFSLTGWYNEDGDDDISFELEVIKPIPGRSRDAETDWYRSTFIQVKTLHIKDYIAYWDCKLAELADAFDNLDARVANVLELDRRNAEREAAEAIAAKVVETDAEVLMRVLSNLIKQEVTEQIALTY